MQRIYTIKTRFLTLDAKNIFMKTITVTIIAAIVAVGFFALAMMLTYLFKGKHMESEISTNKDMQRLGIKCAVQETREDMGLNDCDSDSICSGNCAGCDIDHTEAKKRDNEE